MAKINFLIYRLMLAIRIVFFNTRDI